MKRSNELRMSSIFFLNRNELNFLELINIEINIELQNKFYFDNFSPLIINYISHANYQNKLSVFLLAKTLLRWSDLIDLDIAKATELRHIFITQKKNDKPIILDFEIFNPKLFDLLRHINRLDQYVDYQSTANEINRLNKIFFRDQKLNFNNKTHIFRHLFCTLYNQKNFDKDLIQKLLGHSRVQTQNVYNHPELSLVF